MLTLSWRELLDGFLLTPMINLYKYVSFSAPNVLSISSFDVRLQDISLFRTYFYEVSYDTTLYFGAHVPKFWGQTFGPNGNRIILVN